jgi:hypothetical protein
MSRDASSSGNTIATTGGCPVLRSLYMTYVPGDVIDIVADTCGLLRLFFKKILFDFMDSHTVVCSTNDLMHRSE